MSAGAEIGPEAIDLPSRKVPGGACETVPVPLVGDLRQMERFLVDQVILRSGGNKAAAARRLGLHRRTLYRILGED